VCITGYKKSPIIRLTVYYSMGSGMSPQVSAMKPFGDCRSKLLTVLTMSKITSKLKYCLLHSVNGSQHHHHHHYTIFGFWCNHLISPKFIPVRSLTENLLVLPVIDILQSVTQVTVSNQPDHNFIHIQIKWQYGQNSNIMAHLCQEWWRICLRYIITVKEYCFVIYNQTMLYFMH